MMYTSKKNLVRIMDKLTQEQINQIVDEHLKDEFVGQVEMITGKYNITSFLDSEKVGCHRQVFITGMM